jgi:hypothetical protein
MSTFASQDRSPTPLKQRRAVFAGAVRDCAAHLDRVLDNLGRFAALYDDAAFVIAVSDSTDSSVSILTQWLRAGRQGKVIDLGCLAKQTPSRTARIAIARNTCLAEIHSTSLSKYDHFIMADFDDVLAPYVPAEDFAAAANWLEEKPERAGVFANSAPRYYDIWSLRHETWCPGDCWHAIWGRHQKASFESAKIREVYTRQIAIPSSMPPIRVRSAFGGLGIYKMQSTFGARYCGTDGVNREVADHVAFNEAIGLKGGQLYVYPSLVVQAPTEHLYRVSEFTLRWRLAMFGVRLHERWSRPWRMLVEAE